MSAVRFEISTSLDGYVTATAIAGDKNADVFSAGIGGQLLRAGIVDEVRVHLVRLAMLRVS